MEEYVLMNRFTENFRTGGFRMVRSKEGRFLEKNLMLKNKRECEREGKKKTTREGL
jgi:hypothetical protein